MQAKTETGETLSFNLEELTVAQCQFLTDYTGKTLQGIIEVIETQEFTTRDMVAMVALAKNPDDPESEVPAILKMKVSELDLSR